MKTNILITGGAGNIGSSLARKLSENPDYQVVIADNLSTGSIDKIPSSVHNNVVFIKADCNNYQEIAKIFYQYHFDYVFHFAAVVGVKRTQENPLKVLNDIKGIEYILQLSKTSGIKKFFYASSSEVYGEPVEIPQKEHSTPLNSRIPYAVVKNVGECYCRSFYQEYQLPYTIFRFFNTYGPYQTTDFVIPKFLVAALKNEPITIYGDGSQSRTFTYIDDNVDTMIKIMENNLINNDVINIGHDEMISVLELAQRIIRITNSKSKIVFLPPLKEGDMTRRMPDNSKMKKILNRPLIGLEEGIKKLLANHEFLQLNGIDKVCAG
ncbi:MAG: NAD-dependent epimerase/dehydratase family protein [Bacteroidetes bacterium]|nr:MAG: NAD-dependent epimerase/dehydratase family protein [Bacteroidota bacterium]